MKQIIVIGGGAAGLMAAVIAGREGARVILLEKMNMVGKKMGITGKGRCNITNNADMAEFIKNTPGNGKFLYGAYERFSNEDLLELLHSWGLKTKVERGGRVFPESDYALEVRNTFMKILKKYNVQVHLNEPVTSITVKDNRVVGVTTDKEQYACDAAIICTGGASYPLTGSRGEGQKFAKSLGHTIIDLKPSLVPIELNEPWLKELMGLSLKNISLSILKNNKVVYKNQGEMMFTNYGMSGPLVLSGSRYVKNDGNYEVSLDLKPALNESELDKRLQKDFLKYQNKEFKNSLDDLLPQKMIPLIIKLSNIPENKKVNVITKEERKNLVYLLKNLKAKIKGLRPIEEAIVTAGGINTLEIDPSTMKSKIISNLSFAGEVIDVDAFTGGYNVQIALSTGYIAGSSI